MHHHLKRWKPPRWYLFHLEYWVQMILLVLGLEETRYPLVHRLELEDWKSS